jgi:hypothetical protein
MPKQCTSQFGKGLYDQVPHPGQNSMSYAMAKATDIVDLYRLLVGSSFKLKCLATFHFEVYDGGKVTGWCELPISRRADDKLETGRRSSTAELSTCLSVSQWKIARASMSSPQVAAI